MRKWKWKWKKRLYFNSSLLLYHIKLVDCFILISLETEILAGIVHLDSFYDKVLIWSQGELLSIDRYRFLPNGKHLLSLPFDVVALYILVWPETGNKAIDCKANAWKSPWQVSLDVWYLCKWLWNNASVHRIFKGKLFWTKFLLQMSFEKCSCHQECQVILGTTDINGLNDQSPL